MVQLISVVMGSPVVPFPGFGFTAGEGTALACVTVTSLGVTPVPDMVTVADRELVEEGLALLAVTVIVLLPDPLVGETVNQEASSTMFQLISEVISNVPELPEAYPIATVVGETVRVGGGSVVKCQIVPVVIPEELTGSILQ